MMKTFVIILFLGFSSINSFAQKNNSFNVSAGFIPTFTIFYERILNDVNSSSPLFFGRIGYSINSFNTYTQNFHAQIGILTNNEKSNFEIGLGGGISNSEGTNDWRSIFSTSIGYRRYFSQKKLFFRAGAGFPEFIFIGTGIRF